MVNSPAKKGKFTSQGRRSGGSESFYEVEEVICFKLINSELQFLIKWKGFGSSFNSWEPLDNLVHCTVFREYVNERFKSLETEIYVNSSNLKQALKDRIRRTMDQQKAITMLEIQPFDPFEFRVIRVFYHLLPEEETFKKNFEEAVFKNHFFKLDEHQRQLHDELQAQIRNKEDILVSIENDEDFSDPPNFEYVTKSFLTDEVNTVGNQNVVGCKCDVCSKDSECCPQLKGEPFAYEEDKNKRVVLKLESAEMIYECGDLCPCGQDCINRVSQRPKEIPLCLFKTKNRGYGIKAMANITKGEFILEYVGELIGQREANARPETAYLFDLNLDRSKSHVHTIDAYKYGNLSRFLNHSCEPNARIWFVNNCHGDPKYQKLW